MQAVVGVTVTGTVMGIIGTVGWGLITSFISNRVEGPLMERLTAGKRLENHDLVRALHLAFIQAQERIARDCLRHDPLTHDHTLLIHQRLGDLQTERKGLSKVENVQAPVPDVEQIALLVIPSRPEVTAEQQGLAGHLLALAAPEENPDIPTPYRDRLRRELFEWMGRFFMAQVKYDSVVFHALTTETLSLMAQTHGALLVEIRQMLERLFERLQPPARPPRLPHVADLPRPFNPHFTGRGALLGTMRDHLTRAGLAWRRVVLTGTGGVGKSQAAIQYAHEHKVEYGAILWIHADGVSKLDDGFGALAEQLGLDQQRARAEIRHWLSQQERWLLIFDNATTAEELAPFLPDTDRGHVLITSRSTDWSSIAATPLKVAKLGKDDSAAFLLKRTERNEPAAARDLAEELDGLPLALELAGAYIAKHGTIATYLKLYREHRQDLLVRGGRPAGYEESWQNTWELAYRGVEAESPAAAALLTLAAFLAPDEIPVDMVLGHPDEVPEVLAAALRDPLDREELVPGLAGYSLMTLDGSGQAFGMHRLVQQAMRERLPLEERKVWAEAAVNLVSGAFPANVQDPAAWPEASRLAPHALAACDLVEQLGLSLHRAGWLYIVVGMLRQKQGLFTAAEHLYRCALRVSERREDKLNQTAGYHNLGSLLEQIHRLDEAEAALRKSLTLLQELHGPDHPRTAQTMVYLANVLIRGGDLEGAQAYLTQALGIFRTDLQGNASWIGITLNSLAAVLERLGKADEARSHYEEALTICLDLYVGKHPNTISLQRNLGMLLRDEGLLGEAGNHLQQSYDSALIVYGPKHPDTALCLAALGLLHARCGEEEMAISCLEEALPLYERFFGPDHPETVACKHDLEHLRDSN